MGPGGVWARDYDHAETTPAERATSGFVSFPGFYFLGTSIYICACACAKLRNKFEKKVYNCSFIAEPFDV